VGKGTVYKRLLTLSVIVSAALVSLMGLGYHAVSKWAQGLEGARLGEFAEVAEQVRQDVKRKLDEFIHVEQQRPYTDYLYYYVPDTVVSNEQPLPVLRSPLAGQMANSLAYGYFQVEPDDKVVTPYYQDEQTQENGTGELRREARQHVRNVRENVLPAISTRREALAQVFPPVMDLGEGEVARERHDTWDEEQAGQVSQTKSASPRSKAYAIESLQQQAQLPQVVTQDRAIVFSNQAVSPPSQQSATAPQGWRQQQTAAMSDETVAQEQTRRVGSQPTRQVASDQAERVDRESAPPLSQTEQQVQVETTLVREETTEDARASDKVQIRIEPFVPVVVPGGRGAPSIFGGQVFLLRHVQIEDRHLLQGFQLDEERLVQEVEESAGRFVREGMAFTLPQLDRQDGDSSEADVETAYTAILDFGFGDLILYLQELDPAWITKRIGELQHVYLGIVAVVAVAVALALASLWHTARAQVALAQKKDEFISAVSHELRTPLTSIRMYAEMLENNWLTSPEKTAEYHRNMRQESERLSRLIENVLDFSRLQKGRKQYDFRLGDLNRCVADAVTVMKPYAAEHGFSIETDLAPLASTAFDRDAVVQIVVNLLDNAVKYARSAADKTILIRTRSEDGFTIIEVEDHGPGVPHRQRKKIFDEFYRHVHDAPQGAKAAGGQTTGTGLGLTLVKRFAEAHRGFVEVLSASPCGSIFRVALAIHA
jgi:signal transduction histidine kinase